VFRRLAELDFSGAGDLAHGVMEGQAEDQVRKMLEEKSEIEPKATLVKRRAGRSSPNRGTKPLRFEESPGRQDARLIC